MSEDFGQMLDETFKTIHTGEIIEGTIIDVKPDEIILNIGYKSEGIITRNEYSNDSSVDLTTIVHVGDKMETKVLKLNDGDGQVLLTYKRLAQDRGNKRLEEAFENKDNSLFIMIENTTTVSSAAADSSATIKAGDAYPNSVLGDLTVTLDKSAITAIQIQDPSRFENKDGSICVDFASGFTGNIFAVAKRVGLKPIA